MELGVGGEGRAAVLGTGDHPREGVDGVEGAGGIGDPCSVVARPRVRAT